jgi:hypothetical protein
MAERKLTDLELERELAGDLPAARIAEATDADRARLAELRAESEAFLRSVDVDMEVRRIQQRVERAKPERPAWWRWLVPAGALAAAAAVLLVFLRRHDTKPEGDDINLKGSGVGLIIHLAVSGETSQRLESGDNVKPGDRIRFEVDAAKAGFVAIIGVDGTGKSTIYYPDGSEAAHYEPDDRLLPGAIELDATPGDEHFTLIYSRRPFHVTDIPSSVERSEVVLHKK